jgi:chemotaxis protein MotA
MLWNCTGLEVHVDLATLIGLLGVTILLVVAASLSGGLLMFFDVPSLLIVLGGSFFVVMAKFGMEQFLGAGKVASRALQDKALAPQDLIVELVGLADVARRGGLLALEERRISNPFLKRGVELLVDGQDPDLVKALLMKEKYESAQRHQRAAQVFSAFGDVAPAMGMIGTLVGLVSMLGNMADPKTIGPSMAVALLTTLYGAILANCVFNPLADKLRLRAAEEASCKSLMLDGVLAIQQGLNPRLLDSMLRAYLPEGQRKGKK